MAYRFRVVRYFLAALFLVVVSSGQAKSTHTALATDRGIDLAPGFSRLQPQNQIQIHRDLSAKLSIHDVMALEDYAFQQQANQTPNLGLKNEGKFWFKIKLNATSTQTVFTELAFPSLKEVSFFAVQNNQVISENHTGFIKPFGSRPLESASFVFPTPLVAGTPTTVYISVQTDGPVIAPIIFWEEEALRKNNLNDHSVMFMYFGLVIALALYNLILFSNIKDPAYLFYSLHLAVICWFQSSMMGYTSMYIWGESENTLRYYEPPIAAAISMAIIFQFTRKFLDIRRISHKLDKFLILSTLACIAMLPIILLVPLRLVIHFMFAGFCLCIAALVYSAIFAYVNNARSARYFLVGWGILIAGAVIQQMLYQNLLPYNFFTEQAILFASAIEGILMSIALSDRINVMRREKQLAHQQALEAAEQSNNMKDQFLATISHELRTPMNGVIGALELIDHNNLEREDRSAINVARLSSRRMLTLIDGMLNYTEAQLESTFVNKRSFKLPYDVQDLMDHLHQACASRHLQFNIDTHFEQHQCFYGDIEKIRTLILHLSENALKFTSEGSISISFSLDTPSDSETQQCNLIIIIDDTGVGISENRQQDIFNVFNQLETDYNRQQGGLGIGLALVKRLVTILGGDIQLISNPGDGTRFELSLPVDRFNDSVQEEGPKNLAYIHQKHEPFILIAEDNEVNQKILAALCAKLGYRTIVAVNGEAAVTIAKQVEPALIFMDCQMPLMDGFEATEKIRLLSQQMHKIPIIAVTANASSRDQHHCFEVGMNDHITKPITLNAIRSCLLRWLPEQQHQKALLQQSKKG